MGQALYRKYRPKKLEEVIGQEHITTTLSNSIKSGSISHAYLLTGPKGVGKTSIARILAHQLNNIEYSEDANHLDIIEIDAASNRRIDEIRELRDKVNILPSLVKYKVYIIDEVHMLTREAFNALLKTLEEPPAHVIFILATTESHKLPDTIISRTQHFTFKPIDLKNLAKHLKTIAKAEKIKIDDDALDLISEHGDGSFRDSISLLDQIRGISKDISVNDIQKLLGIAPKNALEGLIASLINKNIKEVIDIITKLREQGIQSTVLAKQIGEILRSKIIEDKNFQNNKYMKLLEELVNVPASIKPDKQLEITLLNFVINNNLHSLPQPKVEIVEQKKPDPELIKSDANNPILKKVVSKPLQIEPDKPKISTPKLESNEDSEHIIFDETSWPLIVAEVKKKYNTLYGVLRMAEVKIEGDKLTLIFKFPFHKKKIDDNKNKTIISDLIKAKTGQDIEITSEVSAKKDDNKTKIAKNTNTIESVSDIFGGAEVLES